VGVGSLNSFKLGWNEEPASVQRVKPKQARDEKGRDVLESVLSNDDLFLDMPSKTNATQHAFDVPKQKARTKRTVFARTRGWYELHLDRKNQPEEESLRRLASEPGYAVQRAMEELAAFQKSGVLPGSSVSRPWQLPDPIQR